MNGASVTLLPLVVSLFKSKQIRRKKTIKSWTNDAVKSTENLKLTATTYSRKSLYQKYKNRISADLALAENSLKKMNFIKSSQAPILASAIEVAKKVK